MSLLRGFPWSHKNLDFKGYSVAGQSTSLMFSNAKICFDIAQGFPFNLNAKLYCLTHLHADHGSGLNYVLSQRSLFRLPQANIMLPAENIDSVNIILTEWMKIEGFEYDYKLIPVDENTLFDFSAKYQVRAFPTTHRVSSFGYIVYEKKKKLKSEFQNVSRQDIINAKQNNITIEEEVLNPIIAFTGDTQIEFIKAHPDITRAQVLFMECTYLDDKKSLEETRKWGHLHFDEFVNSIDEFKNEHISLIHLSARYSTPQSEKIIGSQLPHNYKEKVSIFPRPPMSQ